MWNLKMLQLLRTISTTPATITDPDKITKMYKYWRVHIMMMMYMGYAVFYFTRKSFNFAMPEIIVNHGLNKSDVGTLTTLFYVIYGLSKFISGVMSDHSNPRYFMGLGLIATGIINIFFGFSSSFFAFSILWGLNAFFQGWGWPPCSKLLTSWYSQSERGGWWSIWNTAHNVGGALIPVVVGFFTVHYGWRYGMWVPGIIAVIVGSILCWRLRDKPTTMGLPKVGAWRNDKREILYEEESAPVHWSKILTRYVITNKWLWLLAAASVLVYVVRTAINDWGNLYLTEVHQYNLVKANSAVSLFEVGGFFGSLVAGWGSDYLFRGERGPMNFIFAVGVLISVLFLWLQPSANYSAQAACFFSLGFFIFGPQMLLGMAAAECSHKGAPGAATGFIGLFSYVGAALAGYPVAKILEIFQWNGFFLVIIFSAVLTAFLLIPFIKFKKSVHTAK